MAGKVTVSQLGSRQPSAEEHGRVCRLLLGGRRRVPASHGVLCQQGWPLRQQDWPFGLTETHMAHGTGFWECSTDLDERAI